MRRIKPKRIMLSGLLLLIALPAWLSADQHAPTDFMASKPLILEVRYCECPATNPGSGPFDLLPGFLKESEVLRVAVSADESGFVASHEVSIGYELKPVQDSPGTFRFEYVGSHSTSDGTSTGGGKVSLAEGQWISLFGSRHESESGSHHSAVAVRLIEADE